MSELYKYCDLSLNHNAHPNSKNNTKSHLGTLISIVFIIYCIYYIIKTVINFERSYKIAFNEIFIDNVDNEQIITFEFKTSDDISRYEIYDSNNKEINENISIICDENLNEIKTDDIKLNNYTCFVNHKFSGSNYSNHLLKIHFYTKNETLKQDNTRIQLSIKFKEPTINHENYDDPFVFPKTIKELILL